MKIYLNYINGGKIITDCDYLPIEAIRVDPGHIRTSTGDLSGLKYTISDVGLMQPIVVRRSGDNYTVIDGYRRLCAMKELAISELIVGREVLIDVDETEADARFKQIIANIQREDLDPMELGKAFVLLKERYGYQYHEIAEIIGKTPHYVTSKVGLVKRLSPEVQDMVDCDREAIKCIQDTSRDYGMNIKIIEDIARLPRDQQKDAYVTIRSQDMRSDDALKYLRALKKGLDTAPNVIKEPLPRGPTSETFARHIEMLDREMEELAVCVPEAARLDRTEVLSRIEAMLEKLSSLYQRLKVEMPDPGPAAQAPDAGLAIYGNEE